jgi:hypothetical protein
MSGDDERTENAAMRVLFVLTLTLVVVGLVYFTALGVLHR